MVGVAVIVGIVIASPFLSFDYLVLLGGFLTGFLISSFAMVINDYYDAEVDRLNQPGRPIPSNRVSIKGVKILSAVLLSSGLLSSFFLGITTLVVASFFAFISWLYSFHAKRIGMFGNALVASSLAIPYIYGGAAVLFPWDPLVWFLAFTSFMAGMGREIVKTISDVKGDRIRKIKSVALTSGTQKASYFGASFFLGAIGISMIPILLGLVGLPYLLLIPVPWIVFLYSAYSIVKTPSSQGAIRIKKFTLVGMLFGLIAYLSEGIL
ncbi:MAG: UbiA family prenyltransferase [Nitrososphaerales archaeon]